MKLSGKNTVFVVCGIAFLAYAAILLIAFEKTPVMWLELACGALAVALVAFSSTRITSDGGKGAFLAYPKAVIALACAVVQLFFGLIACAVPNFPLPVAAVVNIALLAACLTFLLALGKSSEYIERVDTSGKQSTAFMRNLQLQLADIQAAANPEDSETISKLLEAARYTDPQSSEATKTIDSELQDAANRLQQAVAAGFDISTAANAVSKLIDKRARICKANK